MTASSSPIRLRVVLVADQHLVGEAVRMALASRGVAGLSLRAPLERRQVRDSLRRIGAFRPNVGAVLCELDGRTDTRGAAAGMVRTVGIPWLLVTSSPSSNQWGAMFEAGVTGVLPMNTNLESLCQALTTLAAGDPLLNESLSAQAIDEWRQETERRRRATELIAALTPREKVVLDSLANGRSVRDIATDHEVAEGTVRSQVKSILAKLGVNSQLAAVASYRSLIE